MSAPTEAQTSHVGLQVADLDRSLAFYHRRLGLELVRRDELEGPGFAELVGRPEARASRALLRLPNTRAHLELIRYETPVGTPVDPLHGNPGTCHVAFYTDDLAETWAVLEANGSENQGDGLTSIVGGPFDGGRVIYCTDPDGIRVEFLEGPTYLDASPRDSAAELPAARANETSHVGLHVADLDRSLAFWVDELGLTTVARFVADDAGTRGVIGLPHADLNMAILRLPGTVAFLEVIEYQNAPGRHPVDPDHVNPGTCHLAVFVDDLAGTLERLRAAAGSVLVSSRIVASEEDGQAVYCTDPDGFRVELVQSETFLDGAPRPRAGDPRARPAQP